MYLYIRILVRNVITHSMFVVCFGCYVTWGLSKVQFHFSWTFKWGYHVNLRPAKVLNCCHSDGRGFVAILDIERNCSQNCGAYKFLKH